VKISNKIANAKAAIVIDGQTGEVIYAQNARKHLKIASMTKMVTMMVVIDKGKYGKKVKITSEAVAARKKSGGMGLVKGDKVRMKDLVHATLMESANDAAAAAANAGQTVEACAIQHIQQRSGQHDRSADDVQGGRHDGPVS
jgi:D-alanyl-D-alanine carboxypeptidase